MTRYADDDNTGRIRDLGSFGIGWTDVEDLARLGKGKENAESYAFFAIAIFAYQAHHLKVNKQGEFKPVGAQ